MRVVLDTNVMVSAFIAPHGTQAGIRQALREGLFELVVSPPLLDEYSRALTYPRVAKRHQLSPEDVDREIAELASFATLVSDPPVLPPTSVRDPKDVMVLECAIGGGVDLIVTGDDDLLTLIHYGNVRIISPASFVALLAESP